LPSVTPTISPRAFTTSTSSGSGLFHCEAGCSPISAPTPTADSGAALVKISASGPMPTSRYCDHPHLDPRLLLARRVPRAALDAREVRADLAADARADLVRLAPVAARLLLHHALEQAAHERHACRLDRLEVARREKVRKLWPHTVVRAVGEHLVDRTNAHPERRAQRLHRVGQVAEIG